MEIAKYYVADTNAPKPTQKHHLGANCLVLHEGRLLLEQRSDCGMWGLPGGGVKRGESVKAAMIRELYEETGLHVAVQELLELKFYEEPTRIAAYRDGSVWRMYIKLYALYLQQMPQLRACSESKTLRFFTQEELTELAIVPTHRELIFDYTALFSEPTQVRALTYLQRDTAMNIDMIEPIRRGHAKLLYAGEDGVLLLETKGDVPMISTDSIETAEKILPMVRGKDILVVHRTHELAAAEKVLHFTGRESCYQASYPDAEPFEIWGDIRKLDEQYLSEFLAHYKMADGDAEYGRALLANGVFGQFVDGTLAGFIGTHIEGAVGMLEVFEPYRRRGIGENLMRYMINYWRSRNAVPFGQIFKSNDKSMNLQRKLGAVISEPTLQWVWDNRQV